MKKTLLIIGLVWPEPKSSAAGTRMLQLIDLFLEQDYQIIFASAAQEGANSFALESLGISKQNIVLNDSSFDLFVASLQPDLVLFDRYITEEQFGWRVAKNCPNTIRILDTEDLHCLRYARHNAIKKNTEFALESLLTEDVAKREIASIYRSDLSLIISKVEMQILQDIFQISSDLLFYMPLFIERHPKEIVFQNRKDFVFIGNFLHEPNWDAVLQLKNAIWPEIKKNMPEARMQVYGAYVSSKVQQLHNEKQGFYINGRAEDALEAIQNARVLLAPLRFGAGIKGKLLEAMAVGTPSITTTIGMEGIGEEKCWNGFVTNDMGIFVASAISLYQDEKLWGEKQEIGYQIVKENFQKVSFEKPFQDAIQQLLQNYKKRRNINFIGSLLQQQQFNSTKYLSKWIEEKNKNLH